MSEEISWEVQQNGGFEPASGGNAQAVIESQVQELLNLRAELQKAEEKVSEIKAKVRNYEEMLIPATMEDMGMKTTTTTSGIQIAVKDEISATPLAKNRPQVWEWMEEHGHDGLIKRKVVFDVGKSDDAAVQQVLDSVSAFAGVFEKKIEPSTLRAFVASALQDGVDIPMELFGVTRRTVAKVKLPRG